MTDRLAPTPSTSLWDEQTLPCPAPSPAAVEAGLFGYDVEGPLWPTVEDVLALTNEHARELASTFCDLQHLRRCAASGVDPLRGTRPRHEDQRAELARRMAREITQLDTHYTAALAAYADGFGWEAADALDQQVRALCADGQDLSPLAVQRELF